MYRQQLCNQKKCFSHNVGMNTMKVLTFICLFRAENDVFEDTIELFDVDVTVG